MFAGISEATFALPDWTLALDIADKLIKLAAVGLGGVWTYWNFVKKRTYAEKLELELSGTTSTSVYGQGYLVIHVDIDARITNVGASQTRISHEKTKCTIKAVHSDLSEVYVRIFDVFLHQDFLEPGESADDVVLWVYRSRRPDVVWLKVEMWVGVSSGELQWKGTLSLRVKPEPEATA